MPSISYNRTDSQQPQSITIQGYIVRPGLHIVTYEQLKLLREQTQHHSQLEHLVSQGVIKLTG